MEEKKYMIKDHYGSILASDMYIEMVLVFIDGYHNRNSGQKVELIIEEIAKDQCYLKNKPEKDWIAEAKCRPIEEV